FVMSWTRSLGRCPRAGLDVGGVGLGATSASRRKPGIAESGVFEEGAVGEALEKREHVRPLFVRKREAAHEVALQRVVAADAGVFAQRDGAATGGVVIEHLG